MANGMDMIREYLVGLGFKVDMSSYNKANQSVETIGKRVEKMAGRFTVAAKALTVFTGAIAGVTAGTVKMLNGLGNQEIQMEMLSRQLWTTQKTAQAFSMTLQSLHANIQELYLSPTLMAQYQQLFQVAQKLSPNTSSYDAQIKKVQNLSLQFKQMRLEMGYAAQWFGMNFIKDMAGPIGSLQQKMEKLNTTIIKNIPAWTQKVASVASGFFKSFSLIGNAVRDVYDGLQKLGNYLPTWVKVVAGAFGAIAVVMASNPFFLAIEGLTAMLLLLDDYYVWTQGGKSALGGFWQKLTNGINSFKQAMKSTGADSSISKMLSTLKSDLDGVQSGIDKLGGSLKSGGTVNSGLTTFANTIKVIADNINALLQELGKLEQALGWKSSGSPSTSTSASSTSSGWTPSTPSKGRGGWLDHLGLSITNKLAYGLQNMWTQIHQGNVVMTPGDRALLAAINGSSKSTQVTIHQSNQFTGTSSSSDVMNGLNQSNSLMMRQFRAVVQ